MFFKKILGLRVTAECGHKTSFKDKVTAFGETIITNMKPQNGKVEYCHKCLEKMVIQCAWCSLPIFIGDSITLYSNSYPNKIPDHAVIFDEKLMQMVGCGRSNCASTGADYAGFWAPGKNGNGKSKVDRVPTIIEQSLISLSSGGDGIIIR